MPYDTLPQRYKDMIPSENGQGIFSNVVNSQLAAGKTEAIAFASAWAALERAGYAKDEQGKWVKKTQPTTSQVHVDGPMNDEDEKKRETPSTRKAYGAEPIYMYRPVLNAEQIIAWATSQGFTSTLPADDMHVTVVFSKTPFSAEYSRVAAEHGTVVFHNVVVRGGRRAVTPLGDKGAVVLKIESDDLQGEHREFRRMGASWDYQEYTPHITITYSGQGLDPRSITPFTGDIVLGPLRAKPMNTNWDSQIIEVPTTTQKANTYTPPEAARNNAKRVLAWREKYGDDVKGMTAVGWARARQLASGKPISRSTVARMSAFNRHRQNAAVAPEYKSEPWKDAGHVAWLGWGGTTGVDWARGIMGSLAKRMMTDDSFTTREEAIVRSMELGLGGDIHVHQTADGQAVYMPGEDHEAYLESMAERAGLLENDTDMPESDIDMPESDTLESENDMEDLLEAAISAIIEAIMEYSFEKTSEVLKVDAERRIVWGWASVSTMKGELVTDLQGDIITPAEMEKMADRFMASARTAKAMHDGDGIGEVLHSLPLTNELAKAFGMSTDREGWIIGMKIHDDDVWRKFKEGTFRGFSIGGRAQREKLT